MNQCQINVIDMGGRNKTDSNQPIPQTNIIINEYFCKNIALIILNYYSQICKKHNCNDLANISPKYNMVDFCEERSDGHTRLTKYICDNHFVTYVMTTAANYGNLDMVKYLHNRGKKFTSRAINAATQNGHLNVVSFLHEHNKDNSFFSDKVMFWAARNGHLDILKYCKEQEIICSEKAIEKAALYGNLEVVKWLHKYKIGGDIRNARNKAIEYNQYDIVKYIDSKN